MDWWGSAFGYQQTPGMPQLPPQKNITLSKVFANSPSAQSLRK
jgi:hypothetical protein